MFLTLIGTLLGGGFRLVPEILKWFDRKQDRKHEVDMFNLQLQADEMRSKTALGEIQARSEGAMNVAELQAIIEATKAQAIRSGVRWVDAISSLMRPVITFWWVIVLYTGALIAQYLVLVQSGADGLQALLALWGPDEKAIAASIISFWFVDRSLRK